MTLPAPVRRNLLLLVVCLAQLMVVLDVSIVNVALPSIRHDLGYSTTGLQWVVNAYTLTFAGFLLLGGRAADLLGRRRVFLAGTGLFTWPRCCCAVADSQATLDGARALQGFGAAIISPATLAILTTLVHRGPRAQPRAGRVGRHGRRRRRGRACCSAACSPRCCELAGDLPHQRAHRARGHRRRPARGARGQAPSSSTATSTSPARSSSPSASPRWSTGSCAPTRSGWGATGVLVPIAVGLLLLAGFALVEGAHRQGAAHARSAGPARSPARGQPRGLPALRRHLHDVVLRLALPAAGARARRAGDRPGLPAYDPRHRRRDHADAEAHRPLRARAGAGRGRAHRRRGHGASVRRARRGLLRRRRPPRRPARRRRPRAGARVRRPSSPSRASSRATAGWPPGC